MSDKSAERKQVNFRLDDEMESQLNWLRRAAEGRPLTIRDVMRQALTEKYQREAAAKKAKRA